MHGTSHPIGICVASGGCGRRFAFYQAENTIVRYLFTCSTIAYRQNLIMSFRKRKRKQTSAILFAPVFFLLSVADVMSLFLSQEKKRATTISQKRSKQTKTFAFFTALFFCYLKKAFFFFFFFYLRKVFRHSLVRIFYMTFYWHGKTSEAFLFVDCFVSRKFVSISVTDSIRTDCYYFSLFVLSQEKKTVLKWGGFESVVDFFQFL